MKYDVAKAIDQMNQWGRDGLPFFFMIDFEMEKIRLIPIDESFPKNIAFVFPDKIMNNDRKSAVKESYFKKMPVSETEYSNAFTAVQLEILKGNSFLLNLSFPTPIETNLTLGEIFHHSKAKYKLYVKDSFLVFSPETFVRIQDGLITSFPMKGTIMAAEPDAANQLLQNPKEKAEHYTIVDLMRNDLSLVATEVEVKRFRYIESIFTNHGEMLQVSSEISGKLPEDYPQNIGSILFRLLPAGSVSGAPKAKTVRIIQSTEKEKRGYYTGICGYFDGSTLDSAVMIRFIENYNGKLRFRSGGGITCNSIMKEEYQELNDKVYVPFN